MSSPTCVWIRRIRAILHEVKGLAEDSLITIAVLYGVYLVLKTLVS
jgi:hypothetical protein